MRLLVARCEVRYTGRLNAVLPESTRLVIVKEDGSVLVHADAGGYKPLKSNCTASWWGLTSECVRGRLPLPEALRDELGPLLLAPAVQHLEV